MVNIKLCFKFISYLDLNSFNLIIWYINENVINYNQGYSRLSRLYQGLPLQTNSTKLSLISLAHCKYVALYKCMYLFSEYTQN
jgi:hypothetical protein